ncbi:hypothetical protein [Burkholderia ambifaria]|uniref:hypothetical protein n=1 Tax=Burkholderia ambifaria TaxID=152480 RepID=UPI0015893229|nr:hypothetical protein [Burkholderia ambifaria]
MSATAPVEYFEFQDLLPGVKHFHCVSLRASLSVSACARSWNDSNSVQSLGDLGNVEAEWSKCRSACQRCPIGAKHAGHEMAVDPHPLFGTKTCGRCLNLSRRLVHKHLCFSCFNRQAEALKGRNRKGTSPVKITADMLRPHSVTYLAGVACDEFKTRTVELATSRREAVVAVLRDEPVEVAFVDLEDQAFADSLGGRAVPKRSASPVVEQINSVTPESPRFKASGARVDDFVGSLAKIMSSIRLCPD